MKVVYEQGSSPLHALNPLAKLAVLVAYSISIFMFDSLAVEVACFLLLIIMMAIAGHGSLLSLLRSKYLLSFAFLVFFIQVLFTRGGTAYLTIPLPGFELQATYIGVMSGLLIAFRFLTIILASALFVATTDPNELAYSLMKAGMPYRFGFMLVTAIRFMPVFEAEANTVRYAQQARGLDIDRGGLRSIVKAARFTLSPLVVSALSKVDVLVISMEGRAFGYRPTRTFTRVFRFSMLDGVLVAISVLGLALLLADVWLGFVPLPHLSI
jgi:energy-coupling factor transport system permease protein